MKSEITRIANPIYDGAFKYLLDDNRAARFFLSVLLEEDVVELQLRPTEHCNDIERQSLTVFRIDFAARIRAADGSEKLVIIEIQKAKYATDIMRFRKYLGQQYASENNVHEDPPMAPRPLPILSIYLLGHKLDHIQEPVIRVTRAYRDMLGRTIEGPREAFIESLTHDSIIIQIPYLKPSRQNNLERLLGLFDQSQKDPYDVKMLSIADEDYPEPFHPLIRRLMKAISDPVIRKNMDVEDEVLNELERLERHIAAREDLIAAKDSAIAAKDSAIAAKDSAIAAKDSAIAAKDSAIAAKDSAIAEKDSAIAASNAQLRKAVQLLIAQGMPEADARLLLMN